jgi:N-acetylmuramoyl-L-alanine amidase
VPASRAEFMANYERQNLARTAENMRAEPKQAEPDRPSDGRPRIVLDPGHGGIDAGAVGSGEVLEKDIVLAFARDLAEDLKKSGQFDVIMTREDDRFVRLSERVAIARRNHADLFLSIHADSFRGHGVRGATVYTLSERASNQMAAQLAESENRSDIIAGLEIEEGTDNDVADILLDLTRRETKNFSIVMAREMVDQLRPAVRLFKNPHQQASFVVLKAPDVASVLVELGYLSNREDEQLLLSEKWRKQAVGAITSAVERYFQTRIARGALR